MLHAGLTLFLVLSVFNSPALAAKRMTIDQLRQTLASAQSAHKRDAELAGQLADVELTERLSYATLADLLRSNSGPRTTASLRALAGASVFLDPPAAEIPPAPAPDVATQRAIMGKTVNYVARTLPTLPDFVATRVTEHFDNLPQVFESGAWPTRVGLHLDGTTQIPIAYRDGRETDDPSIAPKAGIEKVNQTSTAASGKTSEAASSNVTTGLTSWGEFGPILGLVLVDAAKGKLGWSHWETRNGGQVAVFHFAVDRSVSHYNVQYCCVESREVIGSSYSTGGNGRGGASSCASPSKPI
jgi:hypothetical protein